ncbi:Uncharacterized protein HZ326_15647 [Fusarium oxysporum f. sp. albedinis]|nr:Uncharacterized protein HZ326_15647 [Fusarium oxysporum f. sp. albedinis]
MVLACRQKSPGETPPPRKATNWQRLPDSRSSVSLTLHCLMIGYNIPNPRSGHDLLVPGLVKSLLLASKN